MIQQRNQANHTRYSPRTHQTVRKTVRTQMTSSHHHWKVSGNQLRYKPRWRRGLQNYMPFRGKFRSQRGWPKDNYWCKKEIPWPQNYILSGTSKSRTTYNSLTMWVSGFSAIIRGESDLETKNCIIEYLTDIMEDSQDFYMHYCYVQWHETTKIDRVRRAHAPKIS